MFGLTDYPNSQVVGKDLAHVSALNKSITKEGRIRPQNGLR